MSDDLGLIHDICIKCGAYLEGEGGPYCDECFETEYGEKLNGPT